MPQRFSLIPTVSRQIAHEARTVPVMAMPVSRVVNSCEAPAAGHAEKRAPTLEVALTVLEIVQQQIAIFDHIDGLQLKKCWREEFGDRKEED